MIQILKKMFEANPEKSTIVLNDKCSECGYETIIEITPTSGGFKLQGGALFKCPPDGYLSGALLVAKRIQGQVTIKKLRKNSSRYYSLKMILNQGGYQTRSCTHLMK